MPAGIEVNNADGSPHISITTRLTRLIGHVVIDGSQSSGSITHPAFGPTGRPFAIPDDWFANQPALTPVLTFQYDRIDWAYPSTSRVPVSLAIGVF